jgi:Fic family protein
MKRELFQTDAPGQLINIDTAVSDVAFVPAPLPPKLTLDEDLWSLLVQAREELARLDGAGRNLSNPGLLLSPLKRREALKSSSIEGTFATPEQLLIFEAGDASTSENRTPRRDDVQEVSNYAAALELGVELLESLPFCLRLIRDMHARLLQSVRGQDKSPGQFRRSQVHVGLDGRFVPPPPEHLADCLKDFEEKMNLEDTSIDPLVWSFMLHYQFETIHPFKDGNGRVGRLLLSLFIGERCRMEQPWLYMSPWFESHKTDYIDLLFRVSTHGDWKSWIAFCLRGVRHQAMDTLARLEALISLRERYRETVYQSGGSVRLSKIVADLFDVYPIAQVASLARTFDVSYPTAKSDVDRLVELGVLSELPDVYPKTFYAPEIVTVGIGS